MNKSDLLYFNEYGGFSENGKEYIIFISPGMRPPTPWSHIMANKNFGTLVTSNGGGYTWCGNSRENKLTTWSNDPVIDRPSERIFLSNGKDKWNVTSIDDGVCYEITYGFGYCKYLHNRNNIVSGLTEFISINENIKINILNLENTSNDIQNIEIGYEVEPVLGVSREYTKKYIIANASSLDNEIKFQNKYRESYANDVVYMSSSNKIKEFSYDSKATIYASLELMPNENKNVVFVLGERRSEDNRKNINYEMAVNELESVKKYWEDIISKIQVKTPVESMNIMLNGWLVYQTLCCRLYARTSFYQAGGAFGFRDQLQDSLAMLFIEPEITKNQIIYHSKHQFEEGDVEHWWHPEKDVGIRTRYSDDLLWLPFVTSEYVKTTGDKEILNIETNYINAPELLPSEDERYGEVKISEVSDSIYEHCKRAIDISLKYGENGLPRIGSGDWNDGMNEIKGESVWLGFFLYKVLQEFIKICDDKKDNVAVTKYSNALIKLRKRLNEVGWDGRWYRRAFFEDGMPLRFKPK